MLYDTWGNRHSFHETQELDGQAVYRVCCTDRGDMVEMTGTALAREGVELALPELSSEVVRIEALSGTSPATDRGPANEGGRL